MDDLTPRMMFGPGPSDVHPRVLEAMSRPVIGHLDPQFLKLLDEVSEMLRTVFRTANELTFAVSGTGTAGMECALVNLIEPGDRVTVGVAGLFGERLAEIARRCGADVSTVDVEWGEPISPDAIAQRLRSGDRIVALVHAETTTGMWQPLDDIAELCRTHDALLIVDAVTSLSGIPVEVDAWGAGVCYSGTQKCLSVPPGLAPITFSDRARDRIRARKTPVHSWYLDTTLIADYLGAARRYHHTAPISMLYGLHEGLRLALEEGLQSRWQRHERLGARLHAELEGLGFSFVAREGFRLPQLAAVYAPEDTDEAAARRRLLDEFGIEIGGGAGKLAGRVWRIGLMGESCREDKLDRLLEAIAKVVR